VRAHPSHSPDFKRLPQDLSLSPMENDKTSRNLPNEHERNFNQMTGMLMIGN
jgi:hypothetical protein